MPGPINPYLAEVLASLGGGSAPAPDPFAPGAQLAGYGPPSSTPVTSGTPLAPVAPPPNPTGFPSLGDMAPAPPPPAPAGPPPPPPAPGMTSAYEDPNALVSRAPPAVSQGPAPTNVGAEPPPPKPSGSPIGPDPHAFDLMPTMGGGSPAHEVDMRGPTVRAAQDVRNELVTNLNSQINDRDQEAAANEYQMAVSQERAARLREAAYQQSLAEQEEELQARQDDFDQTARQLGRLGQIDHGRFWASRSTGQKIAGAIEVMLSGFTGAPSMIQKRIDDDIKAQEFAYMAGRDAVNAKQTAFGAAMQKYQNANAARAAARVASLDVVSAQLGQIAAMNKGNETGNRALAAQASIQTERMNQIMAAIKWVPAQSGGRYWMDPETGLIYNETEAKARRKQQLEWRQEDRKQTAGIGGQLLVEGVKGANEHAKNAADNRVKLPNGDIVVAPSPPEAEKLRTLAVSVSNANQLVDQAKAIRSTDGWWASPAAMKDLHRIQAELTLAFKDRGGLGALSGPDMELALKGTSDITSIGPGVDRSLDGFKATTAKALQNRVATLPDAAPSAAGQLSPEARKSLGGYSTK